MSTAHNAYRWQPATTEDVATVLGLMRLFYIGEQLVFNPQAAEKAVRALLEGPELGRIFLLRREGADGGRPLGHMVLTWGFSLEFRGRYVLLDELYLASELRGQGLGGNGIEFAAAWAREQGAASLRLEVNHANEHAKGVYLRRGFGDDRRDLMTRWV